MVRAKPLLPKLSELPAAEEDLQELLYQYEEAVYSSAPFTFATFRRLWQENDISYLFETRALEINHEDFIQTLFASALDCLEVPLRARELKKMAAASQRAQNGSQQQQQQQQLPQQRAEPVGAEPTGSPQGVAFAAKQPAASADEVAGMSLEDLIPSDEDEDAEQVHLIAQSLQQPSTGSPGLLSAALSTGAVQPAPQGALDVQLTVGTGTPAEGCPCSVEDLTAFELLEDLPDMAEHVAHPDAEAPSPVALVEPPAETAGEQLREQAAAPEASHYQQNTDRAAPSQAQDHRSPNPEVVRVGAIFLLYSLYVAQPPSHSVRIYVPLHLLPGLTWMVGEATEATAILKRLVADNAFVVGAVRRPISATKEARMAGRTAKSIIAPDKKEQRRILRVGVQGVKQAATSWGSLQHVQLLCNSYRASQEQLWGSEQDATAAPGIFDLDTGKKIGKLVQQMQRQVDMLLPYKKGSTFLQTDLPAIEEEPEDEDESENEGQPDTNKRQGLQQKRHRNAREARQPHVEEPVRSEVELATRRQLRNSAQDDDEMPSLEELGLSFPEMAAEEAELSDSELRDLPKVAVRILQNKRQEDLEVRRRLAAWKSRFESSFLSNAEEQPSQQHQTQIPAGPEEGPSAQEGTLRAAQINVSPRTVQSLPHAGRATHPAEGTSKPARRSTSRTKHAARSQWSTAAADTSAASSLEKSGKRVAQAAGLADNQEGTPECHRRPQKRTRTALPASSPVVAEQAIEAARTDPQPEAGQPAGNWTPHSAGTANGHSAGVSSVVPQPSDQRAMQDTATVEPQGPGRQAEESEFAGNGVAQSEPAAFGGSAGPELSRKRCESTSRQAPAAGGRCSGAAVANQADALFHSVITKADQKAPSMRVKELDSELGNLDESTRGSQIHGSAGSVSERLKQIAASQADIDSLLEDA